MVLLRALLDGLHFGLCLHSHSFGVFGALGKNLPKIIEIDVAVLIEIRHLLEYLLV